MKKNNSYLADDEIDLNDLIKLLWREKILILSISIICGLAGYLYASFQPQEFKTEILLKNPPSQLFEPYKDVFSVFDNNNNNNTTTTNSNVAGQFISDFKLYFLSLDNLQSFVEESRGLDNFKGYLKLRNISAKKYFANKINEVKEKNFFISNKYVFFFTKELDGDIFIYNYLEFTKKKTLFEIKKILKLSIENKIIIFDNALKKAKIINLENPILRSLNNQSQVVNEPTDLFYKGSKILSQEIVDLKNLLIKLENEQFNFEIIVDKPLSSPVKKMPNLVYFAVGLMLGLFLSLGIVFFKGILKNN
jgi:LPS O-antigen subunit length determinant protein (WzzB/FepE family)